MRDYSNDLVRTLARLDQLVAEVEELAAGPDENCRDDALRLLVAYQEQVRGLEAKLGQKNRECLPSVDQFCFLAQIAVYAITLLAKNITTKTIPSDTPNVSEHLRTPAYMHSRSNQQG